MRALEILREAKDLLAADKEALKPERRESSTDNSFWLCASTTGTCPHR